jgi:hypothetical protein
MTPRRLPRSPARCCAKTLASIPIRCWRRASGNSTHGAIPTRVDTSAQQIGHELALGNTIIFGQFCLLLTSAIASGSSLSMISLRVEHRRNAVHRAVPRALTAAKDDVGDALADRLCHVCCSHCLERCLVCIRAQQPFLRCYLDYPLDAARVVVAPDDSAVTSLKPLHCGYPLSRGPFTERTRRAADGRHRQAPNARRRTA